MSHKTANLNLRISPGLKEALRELAEKEHRTVSNLIETMILERSKKSGVKVTEPRRGRQQPGRTGDAES